MHGLPYSFAPQCLPGFMKFPISKSHNRAGLPESDDQHVGQAEGGGPRALHHHRRARLHLRPRLLRQEPQEQEHPHGGDLQESGQDGHRDGQVQHVIQK